MKDGAKSNTQIQINTAHGTIMITGEVLRGKLQFFIDNGIVEKVEPDAPYITLINALTDYGRTLLLVIEVLRQAGETHIIKMKKQNKQNNKKKQGRRWKTVKRYAHVSKKTISKVQSPLDKLGL